MSAPVDEFDLDVRIDPLLDTEFSFGPQAASGNQIAACITDGQLPSYCDSTNPYCCKTHNR
jgi:hypothetical protein